MSWDGSRVQRLLDHGASSEPQLQHRIEILKKWDLVSGSKILEIGCGQGDCTLVLADVVGEHGHVTAIDPAPLDYGLFVIREFCKKRK
jgi:ubiquinone/menaquinone biosynthesis C-methylase UbiE